MLNPIQNQGLRLALGAFRTSPESSLQAEASVMPLELRRQKLSLQYAVKVSSHPKNPVYKNIFQIPETIKKIATKNENIIKPFGLRIQDNLKEIEFTENDTINYYIPETPYWQILVPDINLKLSENTKSKTDPENYYQQYYEILKKDYIEYERIFTDGSKDDKSTSSASISFNPKIPEKSEKIPSNATIFTAEANAIDIAINNISKSENKNFLIITDSLSCLMALKSPNEKNPIILKLKQKIHIALSKNINISLLWIPSHVGIEGNEMADELAKEALSNNINKIKIPYTDFKHNITKIIQSKWQKNWNKETSNKLHYIQPKLTVKTKSELNRNSYVKYTRIKLRHTL